MARQFPSRGVLRRPALRPVDIVVGLGAWLLYALLRLGSSMNASFVPKLATTKVSTDPADLPYYAARSLLRMFIALFFSVLFTFVYGTAAARLRRAEIVMLPALDILQSVPILGFLSITVTGFIALFPTPSPTRSPSTAPGTPGDPRTNRTVTALRESPAPSRRAGPASRSDPRTRQGQKDTESGEPLGRGEHE